MTSQQAAERVPAVLSLDLIRKADEFLDDEKNRTEFIDGGKDFYRHFHSKPAQSSSGEKKGGPVSSQLRNLQQMAVSSVRFSDIEDFVKRQMGRGGKSSMPWRQVGEKILGQLEKLRKKASELTSDPHEQFLLRQYLARGWIRAFVGGYMLAKALDEMDWPS